MYALPENVFCFSCSVGAVLFTGSWCLSTSRFIYSHPEISQICMHLLSHCHKWAFSHRRRHRGHFVLQDNRQGPFCVRTNQWKDESVSSEDGHVMPWVQRMLICAQPWRWWWSKLWCDSFLRVKCSITSFFLPTPWKHVKLKSWNRWKDYSLLISCCPSWS